MVDEIFDAIFAVFGVEIDDNDSGWDAPCGVGVRPARPPSADGALVEHGVMEAVRGKRFSVRLDGKDGHAGRGVGERPVERRVARWRYEISKRHGRHLQKRAPPAW
jgi:hypothetical protein